MTGIETYPEDRLYEEVAFIAYHFHWDREEILNLPHRERQRWCEEISRINERINEQSGSAGAGGGLAQHPAVDEEMLNSGGTTLTNPLPTEDPDSGAPTR